MKNYIISIDGHSGCGKSTLAKKLALELRYTYVDTGSMYRAVALFALQNGLIDEKGKLKADAINEVEKLVIDFTEPNEQGESYIQLNGLVVEKEIRSIKASHDIEQVKQYAEDTARQNHHQSIFIVLFLLNLKYIDLDILNDSKPNRIILKRRFGCLTVSFNPPRVQCNTENI